MSSHLTNDRPRFDDSKAIAAERESDHLKAGDIIQQWAVKNVAGQVKGWAAIPQHEWIDRVTLRRKLHDVTAKPAGETSP